MRAINRCREASVRRAYTTGAKISRSDSQILLLQVGYSLNTHLLIGAGHVSHEVFIAAGRVRVDLRRKVGVGAGGGHWAATLGKGAR
jgi:hypothetical protein